MVRKNAVKDTLSEKAAAMGREDGDWLCFDEDKKDIPMYEVLQRRMALCRRMEAVVMKQMEEIQRDGKLSLTDYFGECAPPVETPAVVLTPEPVSSAPAASSSRHIVASNAS